VLETNVDANPSDVEIHADSLQPTIKSSAVVGIPVVDRPELTPAPSVIVDEMMVDKPEDGPSIVIEEEAIDDPEPLPTAPSTVIKLKLTPALLSAVDQKMADKDAIPADGEFIPDTLENEEMMMKPEVLMPEVRRSAVPHMVLTVPTSINDLFEVKESGVPAAGSGCFARRNIPVHTLVGFYFGVPMTEDEFDSLKDSTGLASSYSVY
jgi:hypothetical protein